VKQDRVGIGDRLPGFGHAYPVPLTHVVSAELPIHIHRFSLQMYTVPGNTRGRRRTGVGTGAAGRSYRPAPSMDSRVNFSVRRWSDSSDDA